MEFAYEIAKPLTDILNTSLREGIVPQQWKDAVVVPLPKSHPPTTGRIIPWIASFHEGRCQRTRYRGSLSHTERLTCGLAQGNKLGPIVFIVHVNKLPHDTPSWSFVDDLNVIESRPVSQPPRIQNDVDQLSSWAVENKMKLNPGKCKAMHICFSRNPPPPPALNIDGHLLKVLKLRSVLESHSKKI
ncbi:hypothetical protein Bbelb_025200 [Branchiostoma belcheri]|nr:hypothetical protein Bbelb_025200 [Branchiostoma belcheri]